MMKTLLLSASATLLMAGTAFAQTSHGIAAVVNDDIVTTHDLRQRTLFMVATTGIERNLRNMSKQSQTKKSIKTSHSSLAVTDLTQMKSCSA